MPIQQPRVIQTSCSAVPLTIKLANGFKERLKGRFNKYEFQVGVIEDGPHYLPKKGQRGLGGRDITSAFAGGPVRKKSRKPSGLTLSQVSKENRKNLGFNYLKKPFQQKNTDIIRFTNEFFKYAFGRSEPRRLTNLLQAIVRNPILKGNYGANSALTQKIKGFNRKMIDTAQLFRAIKAKVIER